MFVLTMPCGMGLVGESLQGCKLERESTLSVWRWRAEPCQEVGVNMTLELKNVN